MMTSETTAALDVALAAAQGEMKDPEKTKWNPHFKKHYADVQDGLAAVRPVLSKHGIGLVQATSILDGFVVVTTRLIHKGEWIESVYPVGAATLQHQTLMGNLTYARRAGLFGLVGIAPDDMDGEETIAAAPPQAAASRQQRATARSLEKASNAPLPEVPPEDYREASGDVPHDAQTGEIEQPELLPPSESEAVRDDMLAKLEKLSKTMTKGSLQVWARQNRPLKEKLQPEHAKDVNLVFRAMETALRAAAQTGQAPQEGPTNE